MEKDERIRRIEEMVREFVEIRREMEETKNGLIKAKQRAEEIRAKSELYSRLERAAGVQISTLGQITLDKDISMLEAKIDDLSKKDTELRKEILTSISDGSKFPFGIAEPVEQNESIIFPIKENFQMETDILKTIFELIDMDYPAKIDDVIIDSTKIIVKKEKINQVVIKVAEAIEKIRIVAKTLSEILFNEIKLKEICEIICFSDKSYRPIVEVIGKNYPTPISTKKIANETKMRTEAVASICSMLFHGKTWAGKCSILKKPEKGLFTFNELGRTVWDHYQKLCEVRISNQKLEKEIAKKEQRRLLNFA